MNEINSQLQPRVKMTQAEFDEFIGLYGKEYGGRGNVFFGLDQAINLGDYYPNLNARLITDKQFDDNFVQAEFVNLWIKFDPSHPEETIKIIKPKKWFVVSKERDEDGDYVFVSDINKINGFGYGSSLDYVNSPKCMAHVFDTEEEANLWSTPKMHAVELEVE